MLIHYAEKKIIIQQGQYSYVLLDEAPELTRFFENLITESSPTLQ
ncbi:hypothetical protein [Brevibacillus choshinensis]|nr:hypothetical protein [Brevibacillus choshinensis]